MLVLGCREEDANVQSPWEQHLPLEPKETQAIRCPQLEISLVGNAMDPSHLRCKEVS